VINGDCWALAEACALLSALLFSLAVLYLYIAGMIDRCDAHDRVAFAGGRTGDIYWYILVYVHDRISRYGTKWPIFTLRAR